MRNALRPLLAVTTGLLMASSSFAQTATTVPVGFMTYSLVQGVNSTMGVPLLHTPAFTGIANGVASDTITVTGATWTPNQFVTGGVPFFVTIRTGAQTGRTMMVTGNTANSLTLDVEDTSLDYSGFAVTANTDSFELFQGDTLASLFGSTADGGGFLSSGIKGGTLAGNSDGIQVFSGTRFVNYFFNTTLGYWVMTSGGPVNQNGFVLYPDDGLMISRRGPDAPLTIVGRVPSTPLMTKLTGGTNSAISVRFPTDTTLGSLNFSGPGTWIQGTLAGNSDTISLWSSTKWVPYFKNTTNQWIKVNGDGTDQSATVIPAGTAILVNKRGSGAEATSFYSQALPYTP